jgi:hypothetical protein
MVLFACVGGLNRCTSHDPSQPMRRAPAMARPHRPIDASAFGTDPAVQSQVMSMGSQEQVQRLGSLRLIVHSSITLQRQGETTVQNDSSTVVADANGNFTVVLETPASSLEVHQIDQDVFVRYDKGSLRRKTRRDVATDPLRDLATAALPQALMLFGSVAFVEPQPDRVDGRPASRYRLALGKAGTPPLTLLPNAWQFPSALPPRWHTQMHNVHLSGFVSVDASTGVLLRGEITASWQIQDATSSPTTVSLHLDQQISHVGRINPQQRPSRTVAEFRRPIRNRDPLRFFRDQIPAAANSPLGAERQVAPAAPAEPHADAP